MTNLSDLEPMQRNEAEFYQTIIFAITEAGNDQGIEAGTGRPEIRSIRSIVRAIDTYIQADDGVIYVDPVISEYNDEIRDLYSVIEPLIENDRQLTSIVLPSDLTEAVQTLLKKMEGKVNAAISNEELFPTTIDQIANKMAHAKAGGNCSHCAALCLSRASNQGVGIAA